MVRNVFRKGEDTLKRVIKLPLLSAKMLERILVQVYRGKFGHYNIVMI